MARRTVVMVVMDGWGIGKSDGSNPIHSQGTPNIDHIKSHYPAGALQASSIAVGLPWNEEGNSEVGHLTLGSGRVIYQHYPRISIAIRQNTFFKNEVLLKAVAHAKQNNGRVNCVGILTGGNVHAAMEHLAGLVKLAKEQNLPQLNLHLFTDGKDSDPKTSKALLDKLLAEAKRHEYDGVKIGSIGGRYYGMDRDGHRERTERAYKTIVSSVVDSSVVENADPQIDANNGLVDSWEKAKEVIEASYAQGLTDEFVEPGVVDPDAQIKPGDGVIFFNFREDSIRQLVEMFLDPAVANPEIKPVANIYMCSFTEYSAKFPLDIAFPSDVITSPLGKVLSDTGKVQLRIAETNKYAHVTYFFNGLIEQPFKNEYRVLVPSQNVARHDEHPEMMAKDITARAVEAISEGAYDFILINYANADIVAHTGNFDATMKAVETVDEQIGRLMEEVLRVNGALLITADHGNAERVRDPQTGLPETQHDISPVPVYIVGKEFERAKDSYQITAGERESAGILSDVAPTILEIMGIAPQPEMTGVSLLKILR